jgi:hypothetical protein
MSLKLDELKASMKVEKQVSEASEEQAREWQKILLAFPQIRDDFANFDICKSVCYPSPLSLANVKLLLENPDPDRTDNLAECLSLADTNTIRRELIEKIALLHGSLTSAEGVVKHRRKIMMFWTPENLRKELARIESVVQNQSKTTEELRQMIRRPVSSGYPDLPKSIAVGNEKIRLDARGIMFLDRETLKKVMRIYGSDQVNQRLAER